MFRAAQTFPPNCNPFRLGRALSLALLILIFIAFATPALAQETREDQLAAQQAEKATRLHPYEPDQLERRLEMVKRILFGTRSVYPFIGSTLAGGGLALGPGFRARYGDTGAFDAHAAWSVKNYKAADARLTLPTLAHGRMTVQMRASWLDAPDEAFYGVGNDSRQDDRTGFSYGDTTLGISTRIQATRLFAVGGGIDSIRMEIGQVAQGAAVSGMPIFATSPTYRRSHVFAAIDSRTSAAYTRRGGLYRLEWSDYRQTNAGPYSFSRMDAEVQQFVPVLRENWVIALRALGSSTRHGLRPGRAVLPDARPWRQPHAPRVSRVAFPRPQSTASDRRVSLDGRTIRRHGAVHGRRQCRAASEGPGCAGFQEDLRNRCVVSYPHYDGRAHRSRARTRGDQPVVLVQPEFLEFAKPWGPPCGVWNDLTR